MVENGYDFKSNISSLKLNNSSKNCLCLESIEHIFEKEKDFLCKTWKGLPLMKKLPTEHA